MRRRVRRQLAERARGIYSSPLFVFVSVLPQATPVQRLLEDPAQGVGNRCNRGRRIADSGRTDSGDPSRPFSADGKQYTIRCWSLV
jgi:hypothetical protein